MNGAPNLGFAIDGSCEGNPGIGYYRCIDLSNNEIIFSQGPFNDSTNNIMEFLALVHILAYCKKNNLNDPIYTDSTTAVSWIKNKSVNTKLQKTEKNTKLFNLIDRAITWIYNNKWENEVLKWNTQAWGEIPADYGKKK